MQKSPVLPVALLALLLLATWAVVSSLGPAASSAQTKPLIENPGGSAADLPETSTGPHAGPETLTDADLTRAEAIPPPQQAQAQATRNLPFLLQVVSKDGIKPVANAEVFFIRNAPEQFATAYAAAKVNVGTDPSALAKPEDIFRTDADGYVNLPAPAVQTQIIARSDSRYGQLFGAASRQALGLGQVAHTLSIHEDPIFTIAVLDTQGKPVTGKSVALFRKSQTSWTASLLAQTNEHGVATFFGLRSHQFYRASGEYGFGFDTPGLAPAIGPLAFENLPHNAELTSTQTACLKVHFFDRFGEAYKGNARVQLMPTSTPFQSWHNRNLTPNGGSTIEYPEVQPGTTFDLKVSWESQGSRVYPISGPAQPGETVEVNITSEQERAILPVRLVAVDGRAFSNVAVDLKLEVRDRKVRKVRSYPSHTNSAGDTVAVFPLTKRSSSRGKSTSDYVAVFSCKDPQSGILLQGELNLGPTPDPITHEQVDIVLKAAPVLAAGYVRTADGLPAVNALVTYGMVETHTDSTGHFVLNTPVKPPFQTLSVSWQQRRQRRIPFTVGAEDLEIILENRDYLVEGQILLPDELKLQSFNLRFLREEQPRHISFLSLPRGQTSFALELPTDQAGRLELLTSSGREVIARIHNVRPVAKGNAQDERLHPWNLRGQIAFAELEVQMNGEALEDFRLIDESYDYVRPFTEIQFGDRVLFVLPNATPEPARLDGGRYSEQEFRATSFQLKPGFQVVYVEPSITVFFAFPAEYKLPPYAGVYVNLVNSAGEEKWCEYYAPHEWEDEFEQSDPDIYRTKLTFAKAGVWSLTAKLSGTDASGTKHSIPLPFGDFADGILPLSVQESSTGKEILLDITQEDLDATFKKAGWVFK